MNASIVKHLTGVFALACLGTAIWLSTASSTMEASVMATKTADQVAVTSPHDVTDQREDVAQRATTDDETSFDPALIERLNTVIAKLENSVADVEAKYARARDVYDIMSPAQRLQVRRLTHNSLRIEDGAVTTERTEVEATYTEHLRWFEKETLKARRILDETYDSHPYLRIRKREQSQRSADGKDSRDRGSDKHPELVAAFDALMEFDSLSKMEPPTTPSEGLARIQRMCELLCVLEPHFSEQEARDLETTQEACRLLVP